MNLARKCEKEDFAKTIFAKKTHKFCSCNHQKLACAKKLVKFSALRAQHYKLYYVIINNFVFCYPKNFRICFFAKFLHFLFRVNFELLFGKQNHAKIFRERTKCEKMGTFRRNFFFSRIPLFAGTPRINPGLSPIIALASLKFNQFLLKFLD